MYTLHDRILSSTTRAPESLPLDLCSSAPLPSSPSPRSAGASSASDGSGLHKYNAHTNTMTSASTNTHPHKLQAHSVTQTKSDIASLATNSTDTHLGCANCTRCLMRFTQPMAVWRSAARSLDRDRYTSRTPRSSSRPAPSHPDRRPHVSPRTSTRCRLQTTG